MVYSQAISIPLLALLGFSPVFGLSAMAYFVRLALMNMSSPVYQTFVMEQVDADSRAMVASLNSMVNSFGRAFSPVVSGWMQVNYGFGPPFAGTISLYVIAIGMYNFFFLRVKARTRRVRSGFDRTIFQIKIGLADSIIIQPKSQRVKT